MKRKPPAELVATRPAAAEVYTKPTVGKPPTKYTPALHERVVLEIRAGNRPHVAAGIAGITSATFYDWMKRGKEGDPHLWQFSQDVELAEHHAEGEAVKIVQESAKSNPDDAKWWLERRRADGFAKQVNIKVDEALNGFMNRLEASLDSETFNRILAVYAGQYTPVAEQPSTPAVH